MADPKYVRLANRLTNGMVADIDNSGWAISGLDVKEFPEGEAAARFVRHGLRDGKLEVASRAEFEEVQDHHKAMAKVPGHQEAQLQGEAMRANRALSESRGVDDEDEWTHDDQVQHNEDRLDEADETDDPAEQVARNSQRAVPKEKKSKAKGKNKEKAEEPA